MEMGFAIIIIIKLKMQIMPIPRLISMRDSQHTKLHLVQDQA